MTGGRRSSTIGVMSDDPDPRGDERLRLVLDEHERERSELALELHGDCRRTLLLAVVSAMAFFGSGRRPAGV